MDTFNFNDMLNDVNLNEKNEADNLKLEKMLDEIENDIECGDFDGDDIVEGAKQIIMRLVEEIPRELWVENPRFYFAKLRIDMEISEDSEIIDCFDEVSENISYKKAKAYAQSSNTALYERIIAIEKAAEATSIDTECEEIDNQDFNLDDFLIDISDIVGDIENDNILGGTKQIEEAEVACIAAALVEMEHKETEEKLKMDFYIEALEDDVWLDKYCGNDAMVSIPNGVTCIGHHAFYYCRELTSITIPNSVRYIDEGAFEDCKRLTSITIPNSVTNIDDDTFSGCESLTSITIPDSVTDIGEYAFAGCKSLTSITIPNSVTEIGYYAFSSCDSLRNLTIPQHLQCSLGTLGLPEGCTVHYT